MGKIFYLMGKSASGKDTIYKRILKECPQLKTVVLYTTRPMREGETEGVEYYFTTPEQLRAYEKAGKIIELRTYQTVYGPWSYATVDDGRIDLENGDYLVIGTLESYEKMRDYYGADVVEPIYVTVDDGLRLERALARERQQQEPKYAELCRRFLADEEDFSEENRKRCGIVREYRNEDLDTCVKEILDTVCSRRQ
ncbi:MAG: guanylate kinase [Eubacteriales bacterium]|nr:guanylate kinase [Eubacteriales bacterium]